MAAYDASDPNSHQSGSRYPGTFKLALREAFGLLHWQAVAWKATHVECIDADGKPQQVGLENLYRRLRGEARAGWAEQIASLLGSVPAEVATPPAHLSEVVDRLLVRLSPPIKSEDPALDVWSQPLVDRQVVATLVIDYPNSMSYVSKKMIAESGESGDAWLKRATANLLAKSDPQALAIIHPESGLMQSHAGDAYDSSRALLLDELLPGHDEFGFYVVVPSRDHLLVLPISAESVSLAPWLRAIAGKTYQDMPYPISPELYWIRGGIWRHFIMESKGEELYVSPPPEFAALLDKLRPDVQASDLDEPPPDDTEPLPN